jgi:hypothetical protein
MHFPLRGLLCSSCLLSAAGVLFGQSTAIGVVGGLRTTDDFQYGVTSESRPYVIGPSIEITLPLGFAIAFEALYERQGYSTSIGNAFYSSAIREADNIWEFPLLARYRFPVRRLRPFAEVGWVPRIMQGYQDQSGCSYVAYLTCSSGRTHVSWPTTHGVAVGGGFDFSAGMLHLVPEVRYIHWNQPAVYGYFGDGPTYGSTQNQVDILLGIRWRIHNIHK